MRIKTILATLLLLLGVNVANAAYVISQGGTATTSFSYGLVLSPGGLNYLVATNSPSVGFLNATDTMSTSTFSGGANFASTTSTTTFANGINVQGGCIYFGGSCLSNSLLSGSGSPNVLTYWTSTTALSATSAPTVAYITGTTTSTSSFAGGIQMNQLGVTNNSFLAGDIDFLTGVATRTITVLPKAGVTQSNLTIRSPDAVGGSIETNGANISIITGSGWSQAVVGGSTVGGSLTLSTGGGNNGGGSGADLNGGPISLITGNGVNNGVGGTITLTTGTTSAQVGTIILNRFGGGFVGIGTTSPYSALSVNGQTVAKNFVATTTTANSFPNASSTNLTLTGALFAGANAPGSNGQVLQTTGSAIQWTSTSSLNISPNLSGGSTNTLTYWTSATAIGATSSPTVGYLISTTTATSSFVGALGIGSSTANRILDISSTTPYMRMTNTSNYATGNWQDATVGSYEFYITDPSGVGQRVVSSITGIGSKDGAAGTTGGDIAFFYSNLNSLTLSEGFRLNDNGFVGIGTTTPYRTLSVNGSSDLGTDATAGTFTATNTSATSSLAGGLSVTAGIKFASLSSCGSIKSTLAGLLSCGSTPGTVSSVATNNGLTGGTITTAGTLGLDLSNISNNVFLYYDGSTLHSSSTPTFNALTATTTTATSTFYGGVAFASTTSTTTFANGISLSAGCVSVGGTCLSSTATLSGGSTNTLTYWTGATTVGATSSPTVGYVTATSTNGTSTFAGWATVGSAGTFTTGPTGTFTVFGNDINKIPLVIRQASSSSSNVPLFEIQGSAGASNPGVFDIAALGTISQVITGGFNSFRRTDGSASNPSYDFTDNVASNMDLYLVPGSSGYGLIKSTTNTGLRFGTNNTERLFIDKGGNVGIATSSPYRALSVYGSSDLGTNALAGSFTATNTAATSTFTNVTVSNITGSGSAPTIATSSGAGTGPAPASVYGNNVEGVIYVTTGTAPASGATIATITFASGRPQVCTIALANNATANDTFSNGSQYVSTTTSGFTISQGSGALGLTAATLHAWTYLCF